MPAISYLGLSLPGAVESALAAAGGKAFGRGASGRANALRAARTSPPPLPVLAGVAAADVSDLATWSSALALFCRANAGSANIAQITPATHHLRIFIPPKLVTPSSLAARRPGRRHDL